MLAAMGGSVPGGACSLCDMHEAARRPWAVVLSSDLVGLGAVLLLLQGLFQPGDFFLSLRQRLFEEAKQRVGFARRRRARR